MFMYIYTEYCTKIILHKGLAAMHTPKRCNLLVTDAHNFYQILVLGTIVPNTVIFSIELLLLLKHMTTAVCLSSVYFTSLLLHLYST